jgi:hypothetical protein
MWQVSWWVLRQRSRWGGRNSGARKRKVLGWVGGVIECLDPNRLTDNLAPHFFMKDSFTETNFGSSSLLGAFACFDRVTDSNADSGPSDQ